MENTVEAFTSSSSHTSSPHAEEAAAAPASPPLEALLPRGELRPEEMQQNATGETAEALFKRHGSGDEAPEHAKQQQQQQQQQQQRQSHSPQAVTQKHPQQQDKMEEAASPLRDTASSPKGLTSSELFLPMLAELFVALFRARCFSSLVLRVLRAVEDEIVVNETFRPYPVFPCETPTEHSNGDGGARGFNCSSNMEGNSCNSSSSSTGDSSSSSGGDRSSRSSSPADTSSGSSSADRSSSSSSSNPGDSSSSSRGCGNSGSPSNAARLSGGYNCSGSSGDASRAEAEGGTIARGGEGESYALFPTTSAAARDDVGSVSSIHTGQRLTEAATDVGETGAVQQQQQQLQQQETSTPPSTPVFASPLPVLFGGYAHNRTSAAASNWSSSASAAAPAIPASVGGLQHHMLRGDSRGGGWRGGALSDYSSRSGSCFSRLCSIPGVWGRMGSRPFGAAAAWGMATDMFSMPFFTKLQLVEAFRRMDRTLGLTKRKVVPPSFNECRMLVNLAQLLASKAQLRLVTFDGDETLYPDGANFEDRLIAEKIAALLQRGTAVAVVTAAGYGFETARYEERLGLLFAVLKQQGLDAEALGHFYVMGGESNYLMRLSGEARLERVPEEQWTGYRPQPCPAAAEELLDLAEAALRRLGTEFRLPASVLRKPRAVGLVRCVSDSAASHDVPAALTNCGMHRENLEEVVIRVRRILSEEGGHIPWSAFNGGKDVWVDVGNKAEGVAILQGMLQLAPAQCMHVGDQFHATGNDVAARVCSPTVWISNPQETAAVLQELLVAD